MCYDIRPVAVPAPGRPGLWIQGSECPCAPATVPGVYYDSEAVAFAAASESIRRFFEAANSPQRKRWWTRFWRIVEEHLL